MTASFISSPPTLIDVRATMPDSAITAMSVVPPPMSITMLPAGFSTGSPTPIAAAIGSVTMNTSRTPAFSAESRSARSLDSLISDGTAITVRGRTNALRPCARVMNVRSISSAMPTFSITPSLSGRMTSMFSGARPSMDLASMPTASALSLPRSTATTLGSFRTIPRPLM